MIENTDWKAAWERCRVRGEGLQKRLNKTIAERDALSARVADLEMDREVACWLFGPERDDEDYTTDTAFSDALKGIMNDERIAALEASQPEMVADVKPLVWSGSNVSFTAETPFGDYLVEKDGHWGFGFWPPGYDIDEDPHFGYHKNIEDAQSAAQADFEKRSLTHITLTPHAEAKREGMLEAALAVDAADLQDAYEQGHRIHFDDLQEFFAEEVRKAAEDVK
jgi:hypothetical protein